MNAYEFVAEFGIEKAKEVLNGAPKNAQRYSHGKYMKQGEWTWWWSNHVNKWLQFEKHIYSTSEFDVAVDLSELKQVVESFEIVEVLGGIEQAKLYISLNENTHSVMLIWVMTSSKEITKAISDYESVESYKENKHV